MQLLSVQIDNNIFKSPFNTSTLGDVISLIIDAATAIAGIGLLLILIFAGISVISGAGSGKPDDIERGKKVASTALIGFLIVAFSYVIIRVIEYIINPGVGSFILKPTL